MELHIIQQVTLFIFLALSLISLVKSVIVRRKLKLGTISVTIFPVVMAVLILTVSQTFYFFSNPLMLSVGLVFYILGMILWQKAFSHLGYTNSDDFWFGRKEKKKRILVTTGPYKYIRHPIAMGIMTSWLGLIIVFLNEITILLYALVLLTVIYTSFQEEKFMLSIFPEYKDYMKKTGRFFPKL